MERRVVLISERAYSTTVNGIERIESQSIPGLGILKVYFQQGTDIGGAIAQITAQNNSILRIAPPGITPPNMIQFNASNVPVVQVTLSSKTMPEQQIFDYGLNFLRMRAVHHSGPVDPGAVRRQAAPDHRRRRPGAAQRQGPVADGRGQRAADLQRHRAGRHRPHRRARIQRPAQLQPAARRAVPTRCRSACATACRCRSATSPRSATASRPRATSCTSTASAPATWRS